jgi:hypothetical protein
MKLFRFALIEGFRENAIDSAKRRNTLNVSRIAVFSRVRSLIFILGKLKPIVNIGIAVRIKLLE